MIEIEKLSEKDIGRWVNYYGYGTVEEGKIKSWNDDFVFVVYKCDHNWERFKDYTGCATNPDDLKFQDDENEET
jgi:hypothetical protein